MAVVLLARAVAELLAVVAEPPGEPVVVLRVLPRVEPVVRVPVVQAALAVRVPVAREALVVREPEALVARRALAVQEAPVVQEALVVQVLAGPVVVRALVVARVVPVPHRSRARCRPGLRPQGPVPRCCWTPGRSAH